MYRNAKRGWYRPTNQSKILAPLDEHMQSFKIKDDEIFLKYRSSLELKSFKYADFSKYILKWGSESFHVKYIKPTDGKFHRYYIDLFIEFDKGDKFMVEIKSFGETIQPKIPIKKTRKSLMNYQRASQTFAINNSKWEAASKFASENNMKFVIITEKQIL